MTEVLDALGKLKYNHSRLNKRWRIARLKLKHFLQNVGDILYVTYGAGSSFGLDMDKAFSLIHDSNMSKLCKTEAEALETVEW